MPYMHLLLNLCWASLLIASLFNPDCNDKSCSARSLRFQTIISAAGDDEYYIWLSKISKKNFILPFLKYIYYLQ